MPSFKPDEITKLQAYLARTFKNPGITLRSRDKISDSVEVLIDGEFLATIYKDEDEGETSYDLNMSILAEDVG